MSAVAVGSIIAACVFAGGLVGLYSYHLLPDTHRTPETQEVVKLGTAMLSVLTSLVLGLLIATAKGSSDTIDQAMRGYAANLILLDATLRDLGADGDMPRRLVRFYTERTLQDVWQRPNGSPAALEDASAGAILAKVRQAVRALSPADAGQRWLQDQALQTTAALQHQRWQMIEQAGPTVRPAILIVVVSWIVVIFASFGLNAPRNATVTTAFAVCSLAIGGAFFLILEMDSPFEGLLRISDQPMLRALSHMER